MPFDVEGAKKAGYSEAEIAQHLAKQQGFDLDGAKKSGYSDADVIGHLSKAPPPDRQAPAAQPAPQTQPPATAARNTATAVTAPGKTLSALAGLGTGVGNTALGAQYWVGRGLKALADDPNSMVGGAANWLIRDAEQGRAKLAGELKPYADANPISAGAGKLTGEVVATLPVGGALAKAGGKALSFVPPSVAARFEPVLQAIGSSGFSTGRAAATTLGGKAADMGARMTGGAITGGASTALASPDDAGTGAVVGALAPPVLKGLGLAAKGAGKATGITGAELKALFQSDSTKAAQELMTALDLTPEQLPAVIAQLRGAQGFVPGSTPTVAQALNKPQASILQRIVSAGPGGEKLREALQQQAQARFDALKGIAPIAPDGAATMRADTGTAIGRYAQAERKQTKDAIREAYSNVDPLLTSRTNLPTTAFEDAAATFTGPGAVGESAAPARFVQEAQALSQPKGPIAPQIVDANGVPFRTTPEVRGANWDEVMRMRSSLTQNINTAKNAGDNQAAAALTQQKAALDKAIEDSLPPEMLARWQEANASRAAMGQRFDTGPQAAISKTRNGEPLVQGGEITQRFWGNRPGLAEDVQSFRRLINDNPALLGQFRSMVTTDGAEKAAMGDELGAKFVDWTRNMLPGLREVFDPQQVKMFQNIAQDIERNAATAKLGIGPGSNTYQNAANALDAGLLDSSILKQVAQRTPGLGQLVLEPARAALAESASKGKARRLADVLRDAQEAARVLEGQQRGPTKAAAARLSSSASAALSRELPSLGGLSLSDLLAATSYRAQPLLAAD